ncbi:hypothetical protein VC83_08296 [Pseudogymnoascus destructans]|uniref:HNH nuclease domain-containing protein n=2 Tax=Pseudogymnoascus destructans TaxID=655981 RepID=L8FPC2_PSED2|nr:uncharacterized protein VC83_08296 [Pseudogymnoascus destructans]ELR02835.1 hypothetical protein GMDG_05771 [Pseudogymnoascus destructans 20631-21]OAF55419.1 hypothetical protein VC83_08296 [Pseudogymnoascus destructans]
MPPTIPPCIASSLSADDQEEVLALTMRSVSASTAFSSLPSTSSTSDFVNAKIESLAADIAAGSHLKEALRDAKKRKAVAENDFIETMSKTEAELAEAERELVVVKRQKKMIVDDLDEMLPNFDSLGSAYAVTITSRIMAATCRQRKGRPFNQKAFAQGVLDYYGAKRKTDSGGSEKYCHLTGWHDAEFVKCAHIVPKSLESDELAYLFGVRETVLSESRNGLTLLRSIETALDNGGIVFVPDKPAPGEDTVWRCLLLKQDKASDEYLKPRKWRELDGKELTFLTPNRPARRYLYLRYIITLLYQKREGNMDWVDQVLNRTDARGYMWATPGAYLRKTMLVMLARKVSDHFYPEAFYGQSTFDNADGCPGRSAEAEEDLAMGFNLRIEDAFAEAKQNSKGEEESGGESDGDEGD